MTSPVIYRTPENRIKNFSPVSQTKKKCRRTLYTPRTKAAKQIRTATCKVTQLNQTLRALYDRRDLSGRRSQTLAEYRAKLKIATVESVKCMFVEYIERKAEELAGHNADSCYTTLDMTEFITPTKT